MQFFKVVEGEFPFFSADFRHRGQRIEAAQLPGPAGIVVRIAEHVDAAAIGGRRFQHRENEFRMTGLRRPNGDIAGVAAVAAGIPPGDAGHDDQIPAGRRVALVYQLPPGICIVDGVGKDEKIQLQFPGFAGILRHRATSAGVVAAQAENTPERLLMIQFFRTADLIAAFCFDRGKRLRLRRITRRVGAEIAQRIFQDPPGVAVVQQLSVVVKKMIAVVEIMTGMGAEYQNSSPAGVPHRHKRRSRFGAPGPAYRPVAAHQYRPVFIHCQAVDHMAEPETFRSGGNWMVAIQIGGAERIITIRILQLKTMNIVLIAFDEPFQPDPGAPRP